MIPAFIHGLERAVMQYQIDQSPRESGGLRQTAFTMDVRMAAGSKLNWEVYQASKSFGVGLYKKYAGYVPLAQNH